METTSNIGRSALILGVSLCFGLLFNYFFFDKLPPGIGFTIYIGLIAAAFFGIAGYSNRPVRGDLLWLFPLLIFFAAMVAVRANELLTALNVLACFGLLLLIMEVSVQGTMRVFIPLDFLKLLWPFKVIAPLIASCADVLSMRHMTDQKHAKQIVRGVLITIPIVAIFAVLLANADPIFEKYISIFSRLNVSEQDVARLIFITIMAVASACFFSYAFAGKAKPLSAQASQKRLLGHIETSILLGSVNTLFLGFIVIQLTYLFGGESNIVAQGLTYAEYARRGFFELVAVAVLSYLVIFATEMFIEKDTEKHSQSFKILSSAVILQVGVIMISAFYRMWLYEQAFGFTTLRLYVHAFIVLLAFVLACLLYKIVVEHRDNTFAFRTFLAIVVFVAGMNFFNPDAFIAQKNLERFASTGDLDVQYLGSLSADATPTIMDGISKLDEQYQAWLGYQLYMKYNNYEARPWMTWNLSRTNERALFLARTEELKKYRADTLNPNPAWLLEI